LRSAKLWTPPMRWRFPAVRSAWPLLQLLHPEQHGTCIRRVLPTDETEALVERAGDVVALLDLERQPAAAELPRTRLDRLEEHPSQPAPAAFGHDMQIVQVHELARLERREPEEAGRDPHGTRAIEGQEDERRRMTAEAPDQPLLRVGGEVALVAHWIPRVGAGHLEDRILMARIIEVRSHDADHACVRYDIARWRSSLAAPFPPPTRPPPSRAGAPPAPPSPAFAGAPPGLPCPPSRPPPSPPRSSSRRASPLATTSPPSTATAHGSSQPSSISRYTSSARRVGGSPNVI